MSSRYHPPCNTKRCRHFLTSHGWFYAPTASGELLPTGSAGDRLVIAMVVQILRVSLNHERALTTFYRRGKVAGAGKKA